MNVSMIQMEAPLRLCHNCLFFYKLPQRFLSLSSTHRSPASYYDVLGVKADASLDEIKNAFFDKSKKLHPDSDPSNPVLHSQFVKLNEAYRVLSKEGTRKDYDLRMRYHNLDQSFRPSSRYTHNPSTAETTENMHYWEQFRSTQEFSEDDWQNKRKKNLRLVGYCLVAMLLSIGAHYFGFRWCEKHNPNNDVASNAKCSLKCDIF